ncbi:helix-turn-helix domain-containing protein [Clostridium thermobutyricum]|uniref:helix-turn-helix domain-containing protein n=1 Tax=Clostridium thermobutyricum TaxID=29372 RepID=UPI001A9ACE45
MIKLYNTIGDSIRNLRKQSNMTIKELSDKLNLTEQAISQYERGKRVPKLETLEQIFNIFNKNPSQELKKINSINSLEVLYMLINQIKTNSLTNLNSIRDIIYPNLDTFNKVFSDEDLQIIISSLSIIYSIKDFVKNNNDISKAIRKRNTEALLNDFEIFDIPDNKQLTIDIKNINSNNNEFSCNSHLISKCLFDNISKFIISSTSKNIDTKNITDEEKEDIIYKIADFFEFEVFKILNNKKSL